MVRSPTVRDQRDRLPLRWRMAGLDDAYAAVEDELGPAPDVRLLPARLTSGPEVGFVLVVCSASGVVVVGDDGGIRFRTGWDEVSWLAVDPPAGRFELRTATDRLELQDAAAGLGGPVRLLGIEVAPTTDR